MASETLPVLSHPDFPQVYSEAMDAYVQRVLARAIVHLNFQEPDQARNVLLDALASINLAKGGN